MKKKSPLFLASFLFKCHPCCMKCLSTFIHAQHTTPPNFRWTTVFFVKPSVNFWAHIVMVPCAFIGIHQKMYCPRSNGKQCAKTCWLSCLFFYIHCLSFLALLHADTAKLLQSCLTLCDPIDVSPPGSPDPGILQARTLEWVAISFSSA